MLITVLYINLLLTLEAAGESAEMKAAAAEEPVAGSSTQPAVVSYCYRGYLLCCVYLCYSELCVLVIFRVVCTCDIQSCVYLY